MKIQYDKKEIAGVFKINVKIVIAAWKQRTEKGISGSFFKNKTKNIK
ncbi:MAG: hypothetical protein K2P30_01715 [Lachnospiraceae bacterium]|nr:hypothetical protein [Lachnospiraceae bacterium]